MIFKANKKKGALKIYVNDILHLHLVIANHASLKTWYEGDSHYIEFFKKAGNNMTVRYDNRSKWENILKLIDKHL